MLNLTTDQAIAAVIGIPGAIILFTYMINIGFRMGNRKTKHHFEG